MALVAAPSKSAELSPPASARGPLSVSASAAARDAVVSPSSVSAPGEPSSDQVAVPSPAHAAAASRQASTGHAA